MTNEVSNDTAVFYPLRFDLTVANYVLMDDPRMGTSEAITRDGLKIDPMSWQNCPHQWIGADGYVDLALAKQHPLDHRAAV